MATMTAVIIHNITDICLDCGDEIAIDHVVLTGNTGASFDRICTTCGAIVRMDIHPPIVTKCIVSHGPISLSPKVGGY